MKIVVTGYAGFIGSNLTRHLLSESDTILGIDCHTYAARPLWVWQALRSPDSRFIECNVDMRDYHKLAAALEDFRPDRVYHLAAESHVCRSIEGPMNFATTNYMGTVNLIEALRRMDFKGRLVHISTDETYGELRSDDPPFDELTRIDPRSPYSASKAASDLMVLAYARTYGLDFMVTRCTNNFGPNQHEEKLIPRAILRFMQGRPMTLYGNGTHSRDWIFVDDHCKALETVMKKGSAGHTYCVGSGFELSNYEVVKRVAQAVGNVLGQEIDFRIEYTNDRPTDDKRYAVDTTKIARIGWDCDAGPAYFTQRLKETIEWYKRNNG